MCMSPHEMSSEAIEEDIAWFNDRIANDPNGRLTSYWEGTRDNLIEILKERAENGTYNNDFTDDSGSATARQGRAEAATR